MVEKSIVFYRQTNKKITKNPHYKHPKQHRRSAISPTIIDYLGDPQQIRVDKRARKKLHMEKKRQNPQYGHDTCR